MAIYLGSWEGRDPEPLKTESLVALTNVHWQTSDSLLSDKEKELIS